MPRVRRRAKQRRGYAHSHVFQLTQGHDYFHDGFGRDRQAMAEAWPVLREQVIDMHRQRLHRRGEGDLFRRPWAWWQFEAPGQRHEGETERDALKRLDCLTDTERQALTMDTPAD